MPYYTNRISDYGSSPAGPANFYRNLESPGAPTIIQTFRPSYLSLPTTVSLEGTSVNASFVIYATNATTNGIVPAVDSTNSGETMVLNGTAYNIGTFGPFPDEEVLEVFPGTNLVASGTSLFNLDANTDFVIEAVLRMSSQSDNNTSASFSSIESSDGGITISNNNIPGQTITTQFLVEDSTGANALSSITNTISRDSWFHFMAIGKPGIANGLKTYWNGIAGSTTDLTSLTNTFTSSTPFTIGAANTAVGLAYIGMWQLNDWITNAASSEGAALAKSRFQKTFGIYNGYDCSVNNVDTWACGTAYDATSSKTRYTHISLGAPVLSHDANACYLDMPKTFSMYQTVSPNELSLGWTTARSSVARSNIASPSGGLAWAFTSVAGAGTASTIFRSGWAAGADGQNVTFRFFAQAGTKNYAVLQVVNAPNTTYGGTINLTDGTITDVSGARVSGTATNIGKVLGSQGDWWEVEITLATAASPSNRIYYIGAADAAESLACTPDGSVSVYLWGFNMYLANEESDIPLYLRDAITQSATNRTAGNITYTSPDSNGFLVSDFAFSEQGNAVSINTNVYVPVNDIVTNTTLVELSDGGSTADRVHLYIAVDDTATLEVNATGGEQGTVTTSVNLADSTETIVAARCATNNITVLVDGSQSTNDTLVTMPDELDKIKLTKYLTSFKLYKNNIG